MGQPFRVGIVGANPDRGWAISAHVPALQALDGFAISAVATTRMDSARATAARFGIPAAHDDWRALVRSDHVDIVAICVKVAHHRDIALAALEAGKHVFCEWPLGLDAAEAAQMADAAAQSGRHCVVGLQGRAAPAINAARALIASGAIGEVISASLVSSLNNWGPKLPASEAYRTRRESGATGLTVPAGHTLDTLCHMLGPLAEVSGIVTTQTRRCEIVGTGETVDVTAPDQVLVAGRLAGGAVLSVHVKADMANPTGVLLQVNGTRGDIRLSTRPPVGPAPVGLQRADLVVEIAEGRRKEYREVPVPPVAGIDAVPPGPPAYTAPLYLRLAAAIRGEGPVHPDFADAVQTHRLLEAVQAASDTGLRQRL